MDPVEKAIRTALEKGDVQDPAHRERVYRAVEAALDRAIKANPQLTVEKALARRRALRERIRDIELEFTAPAAEDASLDAELIDILSDHADSPEPQESDGWPGPPRTAAAPTIDVDAARPAPVSVPELRAVDPSPRVERAVGRDPDLGIVRRIDMPVDSDTDFAPSVAPGADEADVNAPIPVSPPEVVAADRKARSRERRRPFAAVFLILALLALGVAGLMFAYQTGLLQTPAERDTSVHNPPAEVSDEDFDPSAPNTPPPLNAEGETQQNWITVFSPSNPSTASATGGAQAQVMQDDDGSFLRIKAGGAGSTISFDVGQGVLERISNRKSIFSILARAESGQQAEISVECNFGGLGDCGRRRYILNDVRGEYLFELGLPKANAGATGTVTINPDFSGEGHTIDIYEIRAATP